ncbi:MAG: glycosyltransferase family 2 protein [Gammaproteobacteria bacterium]|nr:glycosyltransferase family 2 protein [Gammaproteobacteria bacterium]
MTNNANSADISVIIPTHNRAGLIGRALESIRAQTLRPREVIVVDDGSTDSTRQLLADRYPECTVLARPRAGVSAARNAGIRRASAEWIALLDSDDEWLPEKLASQWQYVQGRGQDHGSGNAAARLIHCEENWIRDGRRLAPRPHQRKAGGRVFRQCLPGCTIAPSAVLMHREVFDDYGLFDEAMPACEDYDLWLRVCAREAVALLPEPLVNRYGGHADQLSQRYWGMDRFRVRALARLLETVALDAGDRAATIATLHAKLDILAGGARRRGRTDDVRRYAALRERFAT